VLSSLQTARGDGEGLDEVTISLLVAARNGELLYDISEVGRDIGLAARATFSRTKTTLEDMGLIDTEKVPIDVGRPRLRLMLGDERLEDASTDELASVAQSLLRLLGLFSRVVVAHGMCPAVAVVGSSPAADAVVATLNQYLERMREVDNSSISVTRPDAPEFDDVDLGVVVDRVGASVFADAEPVRHRVRHALARRRTRRYRRCSCDDRGRHRLRP